MKRLLLLALFLLVGVSLGTAILLAPATAPHAAAYDGHADATMSCTDNTSTMTRTVIVTITWKAVNDGVAEADAQAIETFPADPLASATLPISPPEAKGTASLTLSFNDTTPFGTVQWQLYNTGHIAPTHAGMLDATNFPGCLYP
jgi:hypothetical protein